MHVCPAFCCCLLQWPAQEGGYVVPPAPGYIQLGVSIEPLAELAAKEGSRLGKQQASVLAPCTSSQHCAHPCICQPVGQACACRDVVRARLWHAIRMLASNQPPTQWSCGCCEPCTLRGNVVVQTP